MTKHIHDVHDTSKITLINQHPDILAFEKAIAALNQDLEGLWKKYFDVPTNESVPEHLVNLIAELTSSKIGFEKMRSEAFAKIRSEAKPPHIVKVESVRQALEVVEHPHPVKLEFPSRDAEWLFEKLVVVIGETTDGRFIYRKRQTPVWISADDLL